MNNDDIEAIRMKLWTDAYLLNCESCPADFAIDVANKVLKAFDERFPRDAPQQNKIHPSDHFKVGGP